MRVRIPPRALALCSSERGAPVHKQPTIPAALVAAAAGLGLWFGVASASGHREAWDADIYWQVGFPLLGVVTGILGFVAPRGAWRWGLVAMAAQALVLVLRNPMSPLLLPGLGMLALLALPLMATAYVGVWIRRRLEDQS